LPCIYKNQKLCEPWLWRIFLSCLYTLLNFFLIFLSYRLNLKHNLSLRSKIHLILLHFNPLKFPPLFLLLLLLADLILCYHRSFLFVCLRRKLGIRPGEGKHLMRVIWSLETRLLSKQVNKIIPLMAAVEMARFSSFLFYYSIIF